MTIHLKRVSIKYTCETDVDIMTLKQVKCTHLNLTPLSLISQSPQGPVNIPVFQPVRPLPCVQFQVERVNVEHSVPMYAPELISTVSSLSQPSDNLLHHCYGHLYLKVSMTMFCLNLNCPSCTIYVCFFFCENGTYSKQCVPMHLIVI